MSFIIGSVIVGFFVVIGMIMDSDSVGEAFGFGCLLFIIIVCAIVLGLAGMVLGG